MYAINIGLIKAFIDQLGLKYISKLKKLRKHIITTDKNLVNRQKVVFQFKTGA